MNLKQLRIDAKLTQVQAANLIGAGVRTIKYWEAGTVKPSPKRLKLYIELLNKEIGNEK